MKRTVLLGLTGILIAFVSVLAGLSIGSVDLSMGAVVCALSSPLGWCDDPDTATTTIVWTLRMPRVALAFIVGGGLAVVGVAMQALVRNPLADPYILGLSSGASAGAAAFYLGFLPPVLSGALSLPIAAFAGGLGTMTVVYLVARNGPTVSVARLLLAGVAMAALMAAVTSFITFASPDPNRLRAVLFWLLGSLAGTHWDVLLIPSLITVAGMLALVALARPLDAFLVGEEPAAGLGVPVEHVKRLLIGLAALMTGTLVAYSGAIGFVGLIIPHAVRARVGVGHRRVIPASFFAGGLFLLWADLLARSLLEGQDLPVGIITALAGVPFFLLLLRRNEYAFN